jgi:hypothetical protein
MMFGMAPLSRYFIAPRRLRRCKYLSLSVYFHSICQDYTHSSRWSYHLLVFSAFPPGLHRCKGGGPDQGEGDTQMWVRGEENAATLVICALFNIGMYVFRLISRRAIPAVL